jgi:hypothetical protein
MLTKTLAFIVIGSCVIGLGWWYFDPAGFANNPVLGFFKDLSLRSQGYHSR